MPTRSATPSELDARLAAVEAQLARAASTKRRNRLLLGVAISILFHISLLWAFNHLYRMIPAGGGAAGPSYEISILQETELSSDAGASLSELDDQSVPLVDQSAAPPASDLLEALVPAAAAADLNSSAGGLSLTGGASGASGESGDGSGFGDGLGPGSGGSGASFFGVQSKGTRFAYIVDRSASMTENNRFQSALAELARSVESLPDFSYFHVILFSSNTLTPPNQEGWMQARTSTVRTFIRWLNSVEPGGGTEPRNAFIHTLSLEVRPDVIFFLTDGELQHFTPEDLVQLNARGRKVIVNTIGFDQPDTQDVLKRMAADSGGVYRFVSTAVSAP